MTVTYTADVASSRKFGCFYQILRRWRGSMYKAIWLDLLTFLILYYVVFFSYLFVLSNDQKEIFAQVVKYCHGHNSLIPVSFVLGFYVLLIVKRWWEQYLYIPWPDSIAVFVSAHVKGNDERSRVIRRTVMRYVTVSLTIALVSMSPRAKRCFPTWEHFVTAGLLLESEMEIIKKFDQKFPTYKKHWMPIVWSTSIISRARKEGLIRDDCALTTIVNELNAFRGSCGKLMRYDTISVPLVYTQVVTLAVYSYFMVSLMGRQPTYSLGIDTTIYMPDCFPLFTCLEFCFYVGWLKVAETMINPFGDDDDDFEVLWLIDRHLLISYLIVDEMHLEHPELVRDQYWDEVFPAEIPFADDVDVKREEPPESSTARIGNTSHTALPHTLSGLMSVASGIFKRSHSFWSESQSNTDMSKSVSERTVTFTEEEPPIKKRRSNGSGDAFERLRAERRKRRIQRLKKYNMVGRADTIVYLSPRPSIESTETENSETSSSDPSTSYNRQYFDPYDSNSESRILKDDRKSHD